VLSRLPGTAAELALRDWPLPAGTPSRGTVLLVHGLGEHSGRYEPLAHELNRWGFAVRGYDQFGHGLSDGPRGGLPSTTLLLDDLAAVIDDTRSRDEDQRLVLLGHSMGGLVASLLVARQARRVTALVLSSPALNAGLDPVQKLLVALLPSLLPNLRVGNGLDASLISHDAAQVAAYRSDPLVHDRIAARLARFIHEGGSAVIARAKAWTVPTLLMYAGEDKLVNPQGSRTFEALAPAELVDSHCFEPLYHELFNEAEPGRSQVFETLKRWLDQNLI
jgi:alpha-beta hydrolase superfamily lysophospholipase